MAPHLPPAPPAEGFSGAHEVATHVFTSAAIKQIGLYLIYSSGKRSMDINITEETPPPPSPPPCGVNPPPPPEPEPMPSPGPFEYLGDGCCVHHVSTACSIQQQHKVTSRGACYALCAKSDKCLAYAVAGCDADGNCALSDAVRAKCEAEQPKNTLMPEASHEFCAANCFLYDTAPELNVTNGQCGWPWLEGNTKCYSPPNYPFPPKSPPPPRPPPPPAPLSPPPPECEWKYVCPGDD